MDIETSVIGQILFTYQSRQPETTSHKMPNMKEGNPLGVAGTFFTEEPTGILRVWARNVQIPNRTDLKRCKDQRNVCYGQSGDECKIQRDIKGLLFQFRLQKQIRSNS